MENSKTVKESCVETVHLVHPGNLNAAGRIYGGTLMSWIDDVAECQLDGIGSKENDAQFYEAEEYHQQKASHVFFFVAGWQHQKILPVSLRPQIVEDAGCHHIEYDETQEAKENGLFGKIMLLCTNQ